MLDDLADEGYISTILFGEYRLLMTQRKHKVRETELKNSPLVETFVPTPESRNALEASKTLSPDIQDFCVQEGIFEYLETAFELVRKNFSPVQEPTLKLVVDPETKAEWIVIEFTTQGEINEVFENHRRYTRSWIASVPWPKRRKIRPEYDIKNDQ